MNPVGFSSQTVCERIGKRHDYHVWAHLPNSRGKGGKISIAGNQRDGLNYTRRSCAEGINRHLDINPLLLSPPSFQPSAYFAKDNMSIG